MKKFSQRPTLWTNVLLFILFSAAAHGMVEEKKFFDESRKLTIQNSKSNWIFLGPEDFATQDALFVARPLDKINSKASLSFRVDKTESDSAKKYSEKWLRDYPKFGFELESNREASYGDLKGYEIELKNQSSGTEIKQFIFLKNMEAWLFTCSAPAGIFKMVAKECDQILTTAKLAK